MNVRGTTEAGGTGQKKVENFFELEARLDRERAARDPKFADLKRIRKTEPEYSPD